MYLAGQSIRTVNRYSSPVSVEFDLALLEAEGPIAGVTLTMVPETGAPVAVTVDWAEPPFHLKAGQPYRLRFDLFGHARVRVNGLDLEQTQPATPDGSFHLQLDVSPSRSRWHLRDVRIQ